MSNNKIYLQDYEYDFCFEKHKSSGDMPNMHYHDHYEIYYLLSGTRKHFIGDTYLEIKEGDFAVIPKQIAHKTGGHGGIRILVSFSENFLSKWFTPQSKAVFLKFFNRLFIRPDKDKQDSIHNILNQMETAQKKGDENAIFLSLVQLFILLNNSPTAKAEDAPSALHDIMEYVQNNYATIDSLNEVSQALFISKFHICHLFSKYLEIPFSVYLTQVRLKKASEQLRLTKTSVSEIAENCGFHTTAYFCSVFKKEFGVSPLAYRKAQTI